MLDHDIREAYKDMLFKRRLSFIMEEIDPINFRVGDMLVIAKDAYKNYDGSFATGKVVDVLDNNYMIVEFYDRNNKAVARLGFSPSDAASKLNKI